MRLALGRKKKFWVLIHGKYYVGVVREEDGVNEGGICGETGVLEHLTVENELEHVGVGSKLAVGPIEDPGA